MLFVFAALAEFVIVKVLDIRYQAAKHEKLMKSELSNTVWYSYKSVIVTKYKQVFYIFQMKGIIIKYLFILDLSSLNLKTDLSICNTEFTFQSITSQTKGNNDVLRNRLNPAFSNLALPPPPEPEKKNFIQLRWVNSVRKLSLQY